MKTTILLTLAGALAVMDADLQHPPTSLPVLLRGIDNGADMVLGSRRSASGRVVRVSEGHEVDGGRVLAIDDRGLRLQRGGEAVLLTLPS